MRACIYLSALAVLGTVQARSLAEHSNEQHSSDRFTYPGQSAEARQYNERWDAYMRRLPQVKTDPEITQIDWMRGSWTAQPRDYPQSMLNPANAQVSPPTTASADWTTGRHWLRISFVAEPWHAEWNYFLGHDPVGKRWILQYIATPSLVLAGPLVARAWSSDRLVFGPVSETYKGFRDVSRVVIVRTDRDSFRIVSEVKMPSGKFVAMDDVLFTRATPGH